MASALKKEVNCMPESSGLKEKILELCRQQSEGITNNFIQKAIPGNSLQSIVDAINILLKETAISVLQKESGVVVYKISVPVSAAVKALDRHDQLVYEVINHSGSSGIWIAEIRQATNMPQASVQKTLKILMQKQLIKCVKTTDKRKVYMCYDVIPDIRIGGGPFHSSDHGLDSEFIDAITFQCHRFLSEKSSEAATNYPDSPLLRNNSSYVSVSDVTEHIKKLGLSKVTLGVEHIASLLHLLVLDGLAEVMPIATSDANRMYRAIKSRASGNPLTRTPCGVCPVFDVCEEGGAVSPETCVYYAQWIDNMF